jgi:type II secretory pathway component GspD/PulD (secretin)
VDEAQNDGLINAVVLRVTPEITSNDSIILNELSAELVDYEGWLGESVIKGLQNTGAGQNTADVTIPTRASSNISQTMLVKRKRIETNARVNNGGTIILGGWTGERSQELTSGVPILRNMPYLGKLLFSRAQRSNDRTTLMIFLTCHLVQ